MNRIVFCFLIFFLILSGVSAENLQERVFVLVPENKSSDPIYSSICHTVEELFSFTLTLLGDYEVMTDKELQLSTLDDLSSFADEQEIDKILFGELNSNPNGSIVISMSLFEREAGGVTAVSKGVSQSLLEVFDVTDSILIKLMKEFSDISIGFGSLVLSNMGETGAYRIYLDGKWIGADQSLALLDKVLNKNYLLEVRQTRFGSDTVIHTSEIEILDRKETVRTFSVPYLTPSEQESIEDIKRRVTAIIALEELDTEYSEKGELENLIQSMEDLAFCPALEPLRTSLHGLLDDFNDEMVYRDAIKNAHKEGSRISYDEYMNRLSSQDYSRQAYINLAEFVYMVKTIEAVKLWDDNKVKPGLKIYQEGYGNQDSKESTLLSHVEEEQLFINSIFNAYYNQKVKNKQEVLSLLQDYYTRRNMRKLPKMNTYFNRFSKKKIASLKVILMAMDVPNPVEFQEIHKYSLAPALMFGSFSEYVSDELTVDHIPLGFDLGFGMLVSETFSFTVETGLVVNQTEIREGDSSSSVENTPYELAAVPIGARFMLGNRRSSFAYGLGFNSFIDLPMNDNDIPVSFMPELSLYYKDFFTTLSVGGSGDSMGILFKFGYEFR